MFGPRSLASPFRSTVPLLALIRDGGEVLDGLLQNCGIQGEVSLHLEYEVESPGAAGNPSQTDLMVLSRTAALAVEAKWTEPRYETVAERLSREKDRQHAEAFVGGWLELVQPHAERELRLDDFGDAVYQMVHRAASACAASVAPRMVYLKFQEGLGAGGREEPNYSHDLGFLHNLLGRPRKFPFFLAEMKLEPRAPFDELAGLRKGSHETDQVVRLALCAGGLFDFTVARFETVES